MVILYWKWRFLGLLSIGDYLYNGRTKSRPIGIFFLEFTRALAEPRRPSMRHILTYIGMAGISNRTRIPNSFIIPNKLVTKRGTPIISWHTFSLFHSKMSNISHNLDFSVYTVKKCGLLVESVGNTSRLLQLPVKL